MKKRNMRRALAKASNTIVQKEMQMNKRAKLAINNALNGKEYMDCIGHFIFLATTSGEAWILDHRESLALRLADRYEALPYKIVENNNTFLIEWTEKFAIIEGVFVAIKDGKQSMFWDYPTDKLFDLISELQE